LKYETNLFKYGFKDGLYGFNFAFENEAKKFFNVLTNFKRSRLTSNIDSISVNTLKENRIAKGANENFKKAEKKVVKKSDIGKAISSTFVHLNNIGLSSGKNSFNVSP